MTAILWLLLALVVGDTLARPLLASAPRPRRLATAFLAGFLALTWATYAVAYLLRDRPAPLETADSVVMAAAGVIAAFRAAWILAGRTWQGRGAECHILAAPTRAELTDWLVLVALGTVVARLASQTYWYADGQLHISTLVWSDFGPTSAIAQSFALGNNFPTEYPHFPGFPILYHFLFYFSVGNLTRLGMDPAMATNVLSVASTVAMLALVMALGRTVFRSAAVGRLGAALFFVHGSLAWWPFVVGTGLSRLASVVWGKTDFLASGFPWRGEEWGIWSQVVFLNQRHLAGAVGVLLVAVQFVAERYLEWLDERAARRAAARQGRILDEELAGRRAIERIRGNRPDDEPSAATGAAKAWAGGVRQVGTEVRPAPTGAAPAEAGVGPAGAGVRPAEGVLRLPRLAVRTLDALDEIAVGFQDRTRRPGHHLVTGLLDTRLLGYVVTGFLLGLLPVWNSAVFIAAAMVFAVLFVLLPNRAQMLAVAVAAGSVALPQLLALRPTGLPDAGSFPVVHFGYTIDDLTPWNVAAYLLFTFGPKLLLAVIALAAATGLQRSLFLAFTALVGVAFSIQFSVEVFANHKFLNIWLIALNLFAAAGLVRLWFLGGRRLARGAASLALRVGGRAVAVALVAVIAIGGLIDLMPIKNAGAVVIRMQGDRLFDWLLADTRADDVFLTDLYVTSPILLAGRKVYYGWSYYAWSAGYPVSDREERYKAMLGATDAAELVDDLHEAGIAYVVVDDGMRSRNFVPFLNEPIFTEALGPPVFTDPQNRYGRMVIWRVPPAGPGPARGETTLPSGATATPRAAPSAGPTTPGAASMYVGGRGPQAGRFLEPRGIALTSTQETLVADTGNHRIQRFSADGAYLGAIGGKGDQPGRFTDPNGVVVAANGHVFVADTGNQRVQELDASFAFVRAWTGPPDGFYGPRDLAATPDGSLYVLDQGRARIVRLAPNGAITTMGTFGSGRGQLDDPTGVAVHGDQVYVADPSNARIQVFTTAGAFVRSITVNGWSRLAYTADVAVAPDGRRLYASLPAADAVAVISLTTSPGGTITPSGKEALAGPGSLAVRPDGQILVVCFQTPRVALLPAPGQG